MRTALLMLMLALTAGGCSAGDRKALLDPLQPRWLTDRHSPGGEMTFDTPGPVGIDVESFAGDVIITTNPQLKNQVVVRVDLQSVHGYTRQKEGLASLTNISWTAEMGSGDFGPVVLVRTATSDPEAHFQRANIFIDAPDIEGVIVKTTRGKVYARGIAGPVNVSTTQGDVRVMTSQAMIEKVVILTDQGNIDYRVPGESTGRFDAEAIRGEVRHRIRTGHLSDVRPRTDSKLLATLNDGENPVILRTVDAQIRIAVVHNPEEIGLFIFEP